MPKNPTLNRHDQRAMIKQRRWSRELRKNSLTLPVCSSKNARSELKLTNSQSLKLGRLVGWLNLYLCAVVATFLTSNLDVRGAAHWTGSSRAGRATLSHNSPQKNHTLVKHISFHFLMYFISRRPQGSVTALPSPSVLFAIYFVSGVLVFSLRFWGSLSSELIYSTRFL